MGRLGFEPRFKGLLPISYLDDLPTSNPNLSDYNSKSN